MNPSGNLTANLYKLDITSGSSGIGGLSAVTENNSTMSEELSVLLSEMNVGVDRRAPGCEKVVQIAAMSIKNYWRLKPSRTNRWGSRELQIQCGQVL